MGRKKTPIGKEICEGKIHLDLHNLRSEKDSKDIFQWKTTWAFHIEPGRNQKQKENQGQQKQQHISLWAFFPPKDNAMYFITALLQKNLFLFFLYTAVPAEKPRKLFQKKNFAYV